MVDIACDPELVKLAKSIGDVPVCVSSVEPEEFRSAVAAGADMVELGNYDSFYLEGRTFSAEEVLGMTVRTREIFGEGMPLSVTVPHTLPLDEQVSLAMELEDAGAHVIQTEGGMPMKPSAGGVQGLIEKAAPTLAATAAISQAVNIPTMAASGISSVTAPLALAAGASGVGVGSAVNKLNSDIAMLAAVRQVSDILWLCYLISYPITWVYTCIYTCIHTYTHKYGPSFPSYMHTRTCIYTCIRTCMYTCIHTYTHT